MGRLFQPRIGAAEHQLFDAGPGEELDAIQEVPARPGGSISAAKHLGGRRLVIDSALIANVLDLLAFGCEVQVFGMCPHEIKSHQAS